MFPGPKERGQRPFWGTEYWPIAICSPMVASSSDWLTALELLFIRCRSVTHLLLKACRKTCPGRQEERKRTNEDLPVTACRLLDSSRGGVCGGSQAGEENGSNWEMHICVWDFGCLNGQWVLFVNSDGEVKACGMIWSWWLTYNAGKIHLHTYLYIVQLKCYWRRQARKPADFVVDSAILKDLRNSPWMFARKIYGLSLSRPGFQGRPIFVALEQSHLVYHRGFDWCSRRHLVSKSSP